MNLRSLNMDFIHFIGWSILATLLFISFFGFFTFYVLLMSIMSFLGGVMTVLRIVQDEDIKQFFNYDLFDNPLKDLYFSVDLVKVLKDFESSEHPRKFDQRITGSDTFDAFLNEIFNEIISDYVTNWYQVITANDEFVNSSIKQTVLATSVNMSNRIKAVDWTQFITKQVLEEITTHIRLFKQTKVRVKKLKIAAAVNENTSKPTLKKFTRDKKTYVHRRNKSDTDVNWYPDIQKDGNSKFYSCDSEYNFEGIFFELENLMEEKMICRDVVCLDPEKENEFLCELSEAVLYILFPPETWRCNSLKFIMIDLLASVVLRPLISLLSDPDNINRLINKMCCGDTTLSSDLFLDVLRTVDDVEELTATYDLVEKEIQKLQSRDSGGECELWVRQQLSSLQYLKRVVHSRHSTVARSEYLNTDAIYDTTSSQKRSLFSNPKLNEDMAAKVKNTLQLLEAISDWRAAAQSQLEIELIASEPILEELRSSALEICGKHLITAALPLGATDHIVQALLVNIQHRHLDPLSWFNDIQQIVLEALEDEDITNEDLLRCQPCPNLNVGPDYTQAVTQTEQSRDGDGTSLPDYDEPAKRKATSSFQSRRVLKSCMFHFNSIFRKSSKNNTNHGTTYKKPHTLPRCMSRLAESSKSNTLPKCSYNQNIDPVEVSKLSKFEPNLQENSSDLSVRIIETGLMQDKGRSFGIYAVAVSRRAADRQEVWHVYRRYRDFYDLHCSVKEKWPELANLPFPGKKTFQNTSRSVLERRMLVLDAYLQSLVNLAREQEYTALLATPLLGSFLCPHDQSNTFSTATIDEVLVSSIRLGMKTLKNMPDQFANTVDGVMDGISKVFLGKPSVNSDTATGRYDTNNFATNIDSQEIGDEFGMALRLLEELLGIRGLWLRRRLLAPLRIVIADRLDKKVLEYASSAISPRNVAQYLKFFRGCLSWRRHIGENRARSTSERARARLAAKVALLHACPDELKHIVGVNTARRGLQLVFTLFQRQEINKRFILVLIEGIMIVMFPDNISDLFRRLYLCSPRVLTSTNESF